MRFKIEAYVDLGIKRYRLQQDGSWRKVKSALTRNSPEFDPSDGLELSDRLFDTLEATAPYLNRSGSIELERKVYNLNPEKNILGLVLSTTAYLYPKVYRLSKPHQFTRRELQEVLASGDIHKRNTLVLDLLGYFKLVEPFQARGKLVPIAVRYETLPPDAVGFQAARDNFFLDELYYGMLDGWVTHLYNDELNCYANEIGDRKSLAQLQREAIELTAHLK